MSSSIQPLVARIFSASFYLVALVLVALGFGQMLSITHMDGSQTMAAIIKAINSLVVSLAMYELGNGVAREYVHGIDEGDNILLSLRKAITRFVGTVVIALVLEALIMIIKYSQLELAGNLVYPMGLIGTTALLLVGLGAFLRLTQEPGMRPVSAGYGLTPSPHGRSVAAPADSWAHP